MSFDLRKAAHLLAPTLASIVASHHVWAQDTRDDFDEVVVSAQKREEDAQSATLSVSVISGDALQTMGVRNTSQLEMLVPNSTVVSDRPGQSNLVLRGIGTPIEGLGVDQGVAIYVDGVQVDSPIVSLFSLLDLERVEVLRGPQGTLYGRNAIGGVVNLISKRPSDEFVGQARAGVGNYGLLEGGLSVEGPLVPGVVSGRIAGIYQDNDDGWFDNNAFNVIGENVPDNGETTNATARGMLLYRPAQNLEISLSADYSMTDTSGPAWQPLNDVNAVAKAASLQGIVARVYSEDDGDVFSLAHNLDTINDTRVYGAGLTVDYQVNDRLELVSVTGYRENEIELLEDIDSSPYRYLEVASDAEARSFSQEVRIHYSGERVDGIVGLFYAETDYRDLFAVDVAAEFIAAAGGSQPAITRRRTESQAVAIFGQWDWNVTDRLTLILGGRWGESDKESTRTEYVFDDLTLSAMSAGVDRCFILRPGAGPADQPDCLTTLRIAGQADVPLPPAVTDAIGDSSWSRFSPKLGVRYQVSDGLMAYATYSDGYRDGGFAGDAANFQAFAEETVDAYEVGIKSDWSDGHLRVNGAFFYYDYDDLQLELSQLRNNVVATSVFNAGAAELTGLEVDATWLVSRFLELSLDVGWLDTEITRLDRSDPSLDLGFLRSGNEFPQSPEWTASFVPVFNLPLANGSLTWRSEISYKSSYFQDAQNGGFADDDDAMTLTGANVAEGIPPQEAVVAPGTLIDSERLDSRLIVNTSLSFLRPDERLELTIWARNLFEEEYTVNRDYVPGLVYTNAMYGAPRTFGASVRYGF